MNLTIESLEKICKEMYNGCYKKMKLDLLQSLIDARQANNIKLINLLVQDIQTISSMKAGSI